MSAERIVVVGAGITGLTAAFRLRMMRPDAQITVIEQAAQVGGKIQSSRFAGLDGIDEGADAFLARLPHGLALADQLGMSAGLTSPAVASANVWWNGMHEIPEGLLLGVPTDLRKLAASPLLSWGGKLRAGIEPILPASGVSSDCVGRLIRKRFGRQVHERLVDPLVGSIYAADTDRFSLAGVPQILDLAANHRSLLLGARKIKRRAPATTGPIFATPLGGMADLTNTLAVTLRNSNVDILLNQPVTSIERSGSAWLVGDHEADAVVLATPARPTAPLLRQVSPAASALLDQFAHAGVVMVTIGISDADWPAALQHRSGYLVPKPVQKWVTAVSFASSKWAHWNPQDQSKILRISLGRDGNDLTEAAEDALINAALSEVGMHLGFELRPQEMRLTRWPMAFPQYRPGHRAFVASIDHHLATDAPGLFLAGASYRGIGIPACIADASKSADAASAFLEPLRD